LQKSGNPNDNPHWIEYPSRKTPFLTTVQRSLKAGPARPLITVSAHIRGEFAHNQNKTPLVPPNTEVKTSVMASRPCSYVEQAIARSLSPRRQAGPPGMPGRSYTHHRGYRVPVSYVGALDLQAPNYNYSTGHQYPISNYTVYGPPPRESRPMHKHQSNSKRSSTDEYVHDHSVFTTTNQSVSGYYIIHPDWVSERSAMRRSRSLMNLNAC